VNLFNAANKLLLAVAGLPPLPPLPSKLAAKRTHSHRHGQTKRVGSL
jgi:serine-type D-Ala-D-Ala carboxypeptidase/endopeptidase